MIQDIFESSTRSVGDLAGVFECDAEGGFFYLFDLTRERGHEARGVISIDPDDAELLASDVSVRWNASESFVGLYIQGHLRAGFDQRGSKYNISGDLGPAVEKFSAP